MVAVPRIASFLIVVSVLAPQAQSQRQSLKDENLVPSYQLPELLVDPSGQPIDSVDRWEQHRGQLLEVFQTNVYGRNFPDCSVELSQTHDPIPLPNEIGFLSQYKVELRNQDRSLPLSVLLFTPTLDDPSPLFIGLNFQGNHTVTDIPQVPITEAWVRDRKDETTDDNRATEAGRGVAKSRWPVELILSKGYSLATLYYGEIDPDFDDQMQNGLHGIFQAELSEMPESERPGSIAAWAYGLSCVRQALSDLTVVDGKRVAVIGHSRLGKTALWAGAIDPQFQLVVSNDSGCGGAALSRRQFGETVAVINDSFPHWFCKQFHSFGNRESELPVDQHQLLAMIAPRGLSVASASKDLWADPKGEYLSTQLASEAYQLYGSKTLPEWDSLPERENMDLPPVEKVMAEPPVSYHMRSGSHDITAYDWTNVLQLANQVL